jgi:hypothetical protein
VAIVQLPGTRAKNLREWLPLVCGIDGRVSGDAVGFVERHGGVSGEEVNSRGNAEKSTHARSASAIFIKESLCLPHEMSGWDGVPAIKHETLPRWGAAPSRLRVKMLRPYEEKGRPTSRTPFFD